MGICAEYNLFMAVDQSEARKNFKSLLYKRGWTAKEVAAKIELSERTLYNWMAESNPKNLGSGSLVRLAGVFGVSVEDFVGTVSLANVDFEEVALDETRESLLEELRGTIEAIDDEATLIQIGEILKAAARAAKDNHIREKMGKRRRQIGG